MHHDENTYKRRVTEETQVSQHQLGTKSHLPPPAGDGAALTLAQSTPRWFMPVRCAESQKSYQSELTPTCRARIKGHGSSFLTSTPTSGITRYWKSVRVRAVQASCVKARNGHIWIAPRSQGLGSRGWSGVWEHSPPSFKTVTRSAEPADAGSGADVTQEGTGEGGNSLSILHLGKFQRCCLCGNSWIMLRKENCRQPDVYVWGRIFCQASSAVVQGKAVSKQNWHGTKLSPQMQLQ